MDNTATTSSAPEENEKKNSKMESTTMYFCKRYAVLLLLTCCLYTSVNFIIEYLSYPSVQTMTIEERMARFPAVTFCNLNRIQKDRLCEVAKSSRAVNDLRRSLPVICKEGMVFPHRSPGRKKSHPMVLFSSLASITTCNSGTTFDITRKTSPVAASILAKYFSLEPEEKMKIGFSLTDIFPNSTCNIGEQTCGGTNVTSFHSSLYGNCFTIVQSTDVNYGWYGKMTGLKLELKDDPKQVVIIPSVPSAYGFRVILHPQGVVPQPENEGIDVRLNYETSLEADHITYNRLMKPYEDDCRDYVEAEHIFNREACLMACIQEVSSRRCDCADPSWSLPLNVSACMVNNNSHVCCLQEVRLLIANGSEECKNCLPACREVEYRILSSFTQFQDPVQNYTARVHVFMKSLDRISYSSKAKYQIQDIFGGLGGQMGLWLGLSLFAIFDSFLEFVEHLIINRRTEVR